MQKKNIDIKEEERKINEIGDMLQKTSDWWAWEVKRRAAKLNRIVEKIDQEPTEELFAEFEKIKGEIDSLNLKSQFEMREVSKLEEKQKNLQRLSENQFKSNLKKKLSKSLIGM